ncbi:MAG: hypothetical protein ACFB2X_14355 [Rivularia sp. (in: cyanobacteria)]
MKSGIFAVVSIGEFKLYVGEVHHLKTRWRAMMMLFINGKFPHSQLQATWNQKGEQRRFTFHMADEIVKNQEILGKKQFLADVEISTQIKS